ncbi:hypothetical protein XENOCAPTIV_027882, partial [Xenoophorus captivus]
AKTHLRNRVASHGSGEDTATATLGADPPGSEHASVRLCHRPVSVNRLLEVGLQSAFHYIISRWVTLPALTSHQERSMEEQASPLPSWSTSKLQRVQEGQFLVYQISFHQLLTGLHQQSEVTGLRWGDWT